jgi:3-oxoadipate enol-lactonase
MTRTSHRSLVLASFLVVGAFARPSYSQNPTPAQSPPGDYLEVSDSRIYYQQCGSGPVVVLLHDGLLQSNTWDGAWPALCKKYHTIRYDRRGYGRSDPARTRFSPTEDLFVLLTYLKVRRAIVVGNSSGGALAIDFALAHPEMIEGLYLVGPVVQGMDTTEHFDERAGKNSAPIATGDLKAAAENWSKDQYIVASGHGEARKIIYSTLIQNPQNLTNSHEFEIPNAVPSLYRLSEIHSPTSILVGEFDIPDVHAQSGAIEAGIPGAQRDILKNAGHLIQLEMPDAFTDNLTRFVNRQEREGTNISIEVLRSYVGKYDAAQISTTTITIDIKNGQLVIQTPGTQPFPLFAESESKFFTKVWELEIEFVKDPTGKVFQAIIYVDGVAVKASRR